VAEESKGPDLGREATLTRLFAWLERHYGLDKGIEENRHGPYTTDDVVIDQQGWLKTRTLCKCTCPPYDGEHFYPRGETHIHHFNIRGVHSRMYGGPLKFWEAVRDFKTANSVTS
jgi:hypothetical protein